MSGKQLQGKTIAFLATDGFEQVELTEPWQAVQAAGGEPRLISLESGKIQGVHHDQKGDEFSVDQTVDEVNATDFQGLVLPGGVFNPDALRLSVNAVNFVREFFKEEIRSRRSATVPGCW